MPYCNNCGTMLPDNAAFCSNCSKPQGGAETGGIVSETQTESGLTENVAGLLCYVVGWVTGLIFFLIDKRPFVRFHAAQSMVVFGGLMVISWVLGAVFGMGMGIGNWAAFSFFGMISSVLWLLSIILWVLCMVKAYQHERFHVPIAGDLAENIAGK